MEPLGCPGPHLDQALEDFCPSRGACPATWNGISRQEAEPPGPLLGNADPEALCTSCWRICILTRSAGGRLLGQSWRGAVPGSSDLLGPITYGSVISSGPSQALCSQETEESSHVSFAVCRRRLGTPRADAAARGLRSEGAGSEMPRASVCGRNVSRKDVCCKAKVFRHYVVNSARVYIVIYLLEINQNTGEPLLLMSHAENKQITEGSWALRVSASLPRPSLCVLNGLMNNADAQRCL